MARSVVVITDSAADRWRRGRVWQSSLLPRWLSKAGLDATVFAWRVTDADDSLGASVCRRAPEPEGER